MNIPDEFRIGELWEKVKTQLFRKQDKLTGTPGQVVTFSAAGDAVPTKVPSIRAIELNGFAAGAQCYIDFHYDGSDSDYTARIIENAKGLLTVVGNLNVMGDLTANNIPKCFNNFNLLDNRYFGDPINQMNKTTYANSSATAIPCIDRWYLRLANLTVKDDRITIVNTDTAGANRFLFYQIMESERLIPGNQYTFSVLAENVNAGMYIDVRDAAGSIIASTAASTGELHTLTFTCPQNLGDTFGAYICGVPNSSFDLIAAQLEPGAAQNLAHKNASGKWIPNGALQDKALELAKCQRYQQVLSVVAGTVGTIGIAIGHSATVARALVTLPTSLRCNPSIVASNTALSLKYGSKVFITVKNVSVFSMTENGVVLEMQGEGITEGHPYELRIGLPVILDANL